jgi:hypothetical protein
MRLEIAEDGTRTWVLRQSWLNTFFDCPELGRREAFDGLKSTGTDASAMGTGLHAGAEHHLLTGAPYAECLEKAIQAFMDATEEEGFRWVQVKSMDTAIQYIGVLLTTWWNDVRPKVAPPLVVEHRFKVPLTDYNGTEVLLSGTIDYVDTNGVIWDWKTANDAEKYGKRKSWEHKRWSIQPTTYTYAWHHETGEYAPFMFAACLKGNQPKPAQFLQVERNETHWEWLKAQARSIIELAEANLSGWPLRDQHVLCSPKWCPAWDQCKGALVTL